MHRPSLRNRRDFKKWRTKMRQLPSINAKKIKLNLRLNKRPKGLEKKKRGRFRDSVSFKKKLLIDKLKLMPSVQREPSKRARELLEKEKNSNRPKDNAFRLISRKPDRSNSRKKLPPWLNRLGLKEKITCIRSKNKSRLSSKREKSRRTESKHSLITLIRLEVRLRPTKNCKNKIDWTSWKKAEK